MEFKQGKTYVLFNEYSLFELEKDGTCLSDVESQENNDDPGAVTIELRSYLFEKGFVRDRVVDGDALDDFFLPPGTRLVKIASSWADGVDGCERFIFEGTNIQVVLAENADDYKNFVKEA